MRQRRLDFSFVFENFRCVLQCTWDNMDVSVQASVYECELVRSTPRGLYARVRAPVSVLAADVCIFGKCVPMMLVCGSIWNYAYFYYKQNGMLPFVASNLSTLQGFLQLGSACT